MDEPERLASKRIVSPETESKIAWRKVPGPVSPALVMLTVAGRTLSVVKVRSAPVALPALLLATMRKWYRVSGDKLLMRLETASVVFVAVRVFVAPNDP